MSARSRPEGVLAKIAAIQRSKTEVELTDASGEDAFEFMAAADVFAKVKSKLRHYKVGYCVEAVSTEPGPPARARVRVTLFDVDQVEAKPDPGLHHCIRMEWEGEAARDADRPGGSARTNALKAFWVALFQIQPAQKPPENRREERQQARRRSPQLATRDQINKRILEPARKRGMAEVHLVELANELLGDERKIDDLAQLPANFVDKLAQAVRERSRT